MEEEIATTDNSYKEFCSEGEWGNGAMAGGKGREISFKNVGI